MIMPSGRVTRRGVTVTDDAMGVGPVDIVFLCVKAHALDSALDTLGPLVGPDTTVVPMINGIPWWYPAGQPEPLGSYRLTTVDPDGRLSRAIPATRVVGAVVWVSVEAEGPGRIRHVDDQRFIFGDPFGRETAAVKQVVELFALAGFQPRCSLDIRADIWTKLWGNLAFNPLSALTGATPWYALHRSRHAGGGAHDDGGSASRGGAFRCPIHHRHRKPHRKGAGGRWISHQHVAGHGCRRRLEVDAIVRSVAELGSLAGVPTPTVDAVASLVEMKARQRRDGSGRGTAA